MAVHSLRIKDVDSVCGGKDHVVALKNLKEAPMRTEPMTRMQKAMKTKERCVDLSKFIFEFY